MIFMNPPKPASAFPMVVLVFLALVSAPLAVNVVMAAEASPGQHAEAGSPPNGQGPDEDWKFSARIATLFQPAFLGSKDYQMMVVPDLKVEYQDRFFASLFEGIGYNVVNNNGWRMGPILKYDFGRSEDDDNPFRIAGDETDALQGLGDVDGAFELGGFVEYTYESFAASLELRQALGGHEGLIGEVALNYTGMTEVIDKSVMWAIGPRATFADDNYNDAYFGIDQGQSTRSGLARYSADAGLVSYGIGGFTMIPITDSLSMAVSGGYDRLAVDAADSPLIKERGDQDQFSLGLSFGYDF